MRRIAERDIAIKGTAQGTQISLFLSKNGINRVILTFGMATAAKRVTLQIQPSVQAFQILKGQFWGEQLAT